MSPRLASLALLGIVLGGVSLLAADRPDLTTPEGLARSLRGYLAENLPPILFEDTHNWGQQKLVTRGLEWKGKGKILPQTQKAYKNHGVWRRLKVTPVTPGHTLDLQIRDVRQAGPDRRTFTTFLGMDLRVEAEQQSWRAGLRTYSGSVKLRFRVLVTMQCEVTSRLEPGTGVLPDLVFRMRVLHSDVRYDHLVTEHIAGVGGEMAEWIGDAGHGLLKAIRPSLEKNLLQKASAAIIRAADTREVRVSLGKWFPK